MQDAVFQDLFVRNPLPMWLFDPDSLRFLEVNTAAIAKYGYSREEFLLMTIADIRPPEDVARLHKHLGDPARRAAEPGAGYRRSPDWRHVTRDGRLLWVDIYSHDFRYGERTVRLVMAHDVTALKQASERLSEHNAYFRRLFEASPEAIVVLDHEDKVMDANPAFEALFQYSLDELRGRAINSVIVPHEKVEEASMLSLTARANVAVQHATVRRRRDGTHIEVTALGYPITLGLRQAGVLAIYRDVTESRRTAETLAYHAIHDVLTGLLNRHEFERCAKEMIEDAAAASRSHGLLYMDVDQFKVLNDSLGHEAGDRLLVELGRIIGDELKEHDTLARLGGDEFGALLHSRTLAQAADTAQQIVQAVRRYRFSWGDHSVSVGISIGVVEVTPDAQGLSALLSAAETACYTAKEQGRGRARVFRSDDQDLLRRRCELSWAPRIMDALEQNRFTLYYQNIVPIALPLAENNHYEVLLRMIGTDRRAIPPGLFIPAAERCGLMPALDRWVVAHVIGQLARHPESRDMVAVNMSGTTLSEEGLVAFIRAEFERHGVSPSRICFEITETAAIANMNCAMSFIHEMRELGASIALDDFGIGMSSFNYLRTLSADYLKIDGAFVRDLAHNVLDHAVAEAINKVGHANGIRTVAECVEDEDAFRKLAELGVDLAQGYFIHHPEPWDPEHIAPLSPSAYAATMAPFKRPDPYAPVPLSPRHDKGNSG
jgi:diguanylate cyclase (GGDEF)-like protein/PAS domain S-box-containing protein